MLDQALRVLKRGFDIWDANIEDSVAGVALGPSSPGPVSRCWPAVTSARNAAARFRLHTYGIGDARRASTYLGTVGLKPYFDYGSTDFQTTSGNALAVETYEELGFSSAYKYLSCVNGDFYYVCDGKQGVERKVTIVFDCYGASCMGPFSYGPWSKGWT